MRDWQKTLVASAVAVSLTGCQTTGESEDSTRTKTEGAVAGAVVGALLGAAIGGDAKGAAIGAAIGGGTGYLIGSEVAKRKQQYASTEDYLNAEIGRTQQLNADARAYHEQTRNEIAVLDQEASNLRAQYRKGKIKSDQLTKKRRELEKVIADNRKMQESLQKEYDLNKEVVSQEAPDRRKDDPYIRKLEKENAELRRQIDNLRNDGEQLAQINERLSI